MDYQVSSSRYLDANPSWHVEDSPWKATQIIKMLKKNNLKPETIVEIGCGAGEILLQLHNRWEDNGLKLYGYDIAPDAYEFCKKKEQERLKFFNDDLLAKSDYYDVLLMIDVFEHVEDNFNFIRKSKDLAKYKIYHIPLDFCALAVYTGQLIKLRKTVGHIHHYTKDTALSLLNDCDLHVIDWFYTHSELELHKDKHNFNGKVVNSVRRILHTISPDMAVKTVGGFSLLVLTE